MRINAWFFLTRRRLKNMGIKEKLYFHIVSKSKKQIYISMWLRYKITWPLYMDNIEKLFLVTWRPRPQLRCIEKHSKILALEITWYIHTFSKKTKLFELDIYFNVKYDIVNSLRSSIVLYKKWHCKKCLVYVSNQPIYVATTLSLPKCRSMEN